MTTNKFSAFAKIVAASFQAVAKAAQAYVTGVDGDVLYQSYLSAFPEGTNPIFKKATEHECSCCRHFIRRAGNVVAVSDQGAIRTIWDEAAEKAPHLAILAEKQDGKLSDLSEKELQRRIAALED